MPKSFMCIGGPFAGKKKTWDEVKVKKHYYPYNAAGYAPLSYVYVWLEQKFVDL